jgi:hypothetical protein
MCGQVKGMCGRVIRSPGPQAATSIETGLLRMQGEILRAFQSSRQQNPDSSGEEACRALGGTGGGIHKDVI